jgi:hypothetical protein
MGTGGQVLCRHVAGPRALAGRVAVNAAVPVTLRGLGPFIGSRRAATRNNEPAQDYTKNSR